MNRIVVCEWNAILYGTFFLEKDYKMLKILSIEGNNEWYSDISWRIMGIFNKIQHGICGECQNTSVDYILANNPDVGFQKKDNMHDAVR